MMTRHVLRHLAQGGKITAMGSLGLLPLAIDTAHLSNALDPHGMAPSRSVVLPVIISPFDHGNENEPRTDSAAWIAMTYTSAAPSQGAVHIVTRT